MNTLGLISSGGRILIMTELGMQSSAANVRGLKQCNCYIVHTVAPYPIYGLHTFTLFISWASENVVVLTGTCVCASSWQTEVLATTIVMLTASVHCVCSVCRETITAYIVACSMFQVPYAEQDHLHTLLT